MNITELLREANSAQASDLHLSVGSEPVFRIHGELVPHGHRLQPSDTEAMAREMMNDKQWRTLEEDGEVDFAYSLHGVSRFRVNAYRQRGCISVAIRLIPNGIPALEDLGLPEVVQTLSEQETGLVLVTGPTGSGKTTTLAAMVDHINRTERRRIITLEDPIEYLHSHRNSIVDQREIGFDTKGFAPALRAALRQDPDVILVGEMRDLATISTAVTAAETGHLVLATLHTSDAVQTIDRVIDVFTPDQQPQIRLQMASVLQGIISQRLLKSADGNGRVAAVEVLVNTPAVANLVRSEKSHQIRTVMQTGKAYGMQTMEMHIKELIAAKVIDESILRPSAGRMNDAIRL